MYLGSMLGPTGPTIWGNCQFGLEGSHLITAGEQYNLWRKNFANATFRIQGFWVRVFLHSRARGLGV